jgi:hypothetical protein
LDKLYVYHPYVIYVSGGGIYVSGGWIYVSGGGIYVSGGGIYVSGGGIYVSGGGICCDDDEGRQSFYGPSLFYLRDLLLRLQLFVLSLYIIIIKKYILREIILLNNCEQ